MARLVVSITGSTATGTSTLTERLTQLLGWESVLSESYLNRSPFFTSFLEDPRRWAFHNQGFFIAEYVSMYQAAIQSSTCRARVLCLDYAVAELAVYTDAMRKMGFLTGEEHKVLRKYWELFKPHLAVPDLLIYLVCDIDVVMRRLHRRGRSGEFNIDVKYVKALQSSFEEFVASWTQCPILSVDSEESNFHEDETIATIAERVTSALSSKNRQTAEDV